MSTGVVIALIGAALATILAGVGSALGVAAGGQAAAAALFQEQRDYAYGSRPQRQGGQQQALAA